VSDAGAQAGGGPYRCNGSWARVRQSSEWKASLTRTAYWFRGWRAVANTGSRTLRAADGLSRPSVNPDRVRDRLAGGGGGQFAPTAGPVSRVVCAGRRAAWATGIEEA